MAGKVIVNPQTNQKEGSGIGTGKLTENATLILSSWQEEGLSAHQLAQRFDSSLTAMVEFLRRNGYPLLRMSNSSENTCANYWGKKETETIDFLAGALIAKEVRWHNDRPALMLPCSGAGQAATLAKTLKGEARDRWVVVDDPELLLQVAKKACKFQDKACNLYSLLLKEKELRELEAERASLETALQES